MWVDYVLDAFADASMKMYPTPVRRNFTDADLRPNGLGVENLGQQGGFLLTRTPNERLCWCVDVTERSARDNE